MRPTSEEFCDLLDNILTNSPLGNPIRANMYQTHGYLAETTIAPFRRIGRISKYYGKKLRVGVTLSRKGHLITWETRDPSYNDIIKALTTVEHGIVESIVILSSSSKRYIQTDVKSLEYRDGSAGDHYYCPLEFLSSALIQRVFLSYAQGCSWWKEQIWWKEGFSP